MKWITRERPKIDRIACPWLIRRFIDPQAEFLFAPEAQVKVQARKLNAIPFDISGVELTHHGEECTFDAIIRKYKVRDKAVLVIADIVRGADTDRHDLAAQSAGLWAISAGLAHNFQDDYELLSKGMMIYDALYSWAKFLRDRHHTDNPDEQLLLQFFHKYLRGKDKGRAPVWARKLKDIIQDQIDTNLALNLKQISRDLNINPSYLSRAFSKYFNNLSFGEYIRKMRIEKAVKLLGDPGKSLSEIAYLTGFSDQSHFIRNFRKQMGMPPSVYRKMLNGKA